MVWLADIPTARVLLRVPVPTISSSEFTTGDELLASLERATGGTFEREGD